MTDARIQQKQRHKEADEKEEKEQRHKEVDWLSYFKSIKGVCPWSLRAYMQDKILHVTTGGGCELIWCSCFTASKHEALLFEYPHETCIKMLNKHVRRIEKRYPELIAFWSHPSEGDQNTEVPVVIVQDRKLLTDLRKKIGFEDE